MRSDFDNDGVIDLNFLHFQVVSSSVQVHEALFGGAVGASVMGTGVAGYTAITPQVLAAGSDVGSSAPNWNDIATSSGSNIGMLAYIYQGYPPLGNWSGQAGFAGFRFLAGDGQQHYGWVELEVPVGATQVMIKSYAYEATPNAGIEAGATCRVVREWRLGEPTGRLLIFPNPVRDHVVVRLFRRSDRRARMEDHELHWPCVCRGTVQRRGG
jgi:hypothetical protein